MAIPRGMAKSPLGAKKKKPKGSVSKAAIGAPPENSPSTPSTPDMPSIPTTPQSTSTPPGGETIGNRTYYSPKGINEPFTPVGVRNDNEWHHDDAHVVSEHLMNYGKNPLSVVEYWMRDNGAALKRAEPYGADGRFTIGPNDITGPPGLLTSDKYKNAQKQGPGYVPPDGMSAPTTKSKPKKPSGDQHAGSYSVESIRGVPGSYATGITNGMTNRDKYVKY